MAKFLIFVLIVCAAYVFYSAYPKQTKALLFGIYTMVVVKAQEAVKFVQTEIEKEKKRKNCVAPIHIRNDWRNTHYKEENS